MSRGPIIDTDITGEAESPEQRERAVAYDQLTAAIQSGRPLSLAVQRALCRVLSTLQLNEKRPWALGTFGVSEAEQEEAKRWHSAGWHSAVGEYRKLLDEVCEHGVSEASS